MENPNVAPGITNLLGPAAPSDSLAATQISQRCVWYKPMRKADIHYRYPAI